MSNLTTLKDVMAISAPFVSSLVKTFLEPRLEAVKKELGVKLQDPELVFREYLGRAYAKQYFLRTIAFQNRQKSLASLYVPLTVVRRANRKRDIVSETHQIESFSDGFLPKYEKILLTDTAGMGKSTLLRYLFLQCIEGQHGIPIFIELRNLTDNREILDLICSEIDTIDSKVSRDFVLKLIAGGNFVFFFDGYDEVVQDHREKLTLHLQDFISKATGNLFILSSRPEEGLSSFPDFEAFDIRPLVKVEAYELIRKYGEDDDIAERLIGELESADLKLVIGEFLTSPLLVSLLYTAYNYRNTVPLEQQSFYRQVYDALFTGHDATKSGFQRPKRSSLSIDDFHRVLRGLGYFTLIRGVVSSSKDDLLELIHKARLNSPGLSFDASDFLQDLLNAVPLFYRDGLQYGWKHKALQEYFAAEFICRDTKASQEQILRRMVQSEKRRSYANTLDLCSLIDSKTFRRSVFYDFMCRFVDYYNNAYVNIDRARISEKEIAWRKSAQFGITGGQVVWFDYYDHHQNHVWTGPEVVNKTTDTDYFFKSTKFVERQQILHSAPINDNYFTYLDAIANDEAYPFSDDPEARYNSPSLFADTTQSIGFQMIFDIEKCKQLKDTIMRELEHDKDDIYLLGQL